MILIEVNLVRPLISDKDHRQRIVSDSMSYGSLHLKSETSSSDTISMSIFHLKNLILQSTIKRDSLCLIASRLQGVTTL